MGRQDARALTLDTGALVGFERGDRRVGALIAEAHLTKRRLVVPAGVLAQAWRGGGPRQALLANLLSGRYVTIEPLDRVRALAAGQLCARTRTSDVIDASVVVTAWDHGRVVVTSDAGDLHRLDPTLTLIEI